MQFCQACVRQYEKTQVGKCTWSSRTVSGGICPHDFPSPFTVHSFYRSARLSGLWDSILVHLVRVTRQRAGLNERPTQALIDSQNVKTTGQVLAWEKNDR